MKRISVLLQCALVALIVLTSAVPAIAKGETAAFQTGFELWRGADGGFAGWTLQGTLLARYQMPNGPQIGPILALDPQTAASETDTYAAGAYYGGNFYNGGSYYVGEATSPELVTPFAFQEAIASWNATTPAGTWIETLVRAKLGGRWTKWYNLGVWASETGTIQRHSVRLQGDADGFVATDTLVLSKGKVAADALQVKVRLFSLTNTTGPIVRSVGLAYSNTQGKKAAASAGNPALWNTLLAVPECSQMVYLDGGNVWCSPTSVSMVLGYWTIDAGLDAGPCEPRVRAAVAGVYDWIYDGHGNWPFNTAYAASLGYEGYVVRYTSLDQLEPWVAQGVPVVMSIAWSKSDLTGAAVSSSAGHLVVLVGFDASGNPIVNDPAAAADADVQRTYIREELEAVWLDNSAGTVYVIFPGGHPIPDL